MCSDTVPRVVVRADAGPHIGSGHLIRSLTVAAHLRDRGMSVAVAIRQPAPALRNRILAAGHRVLALDLDVPPSDLLSRPWPSAVQERDATALLQALHDDVHAVIVDHYGLDATWESRLRARASRVIVIDDLADRDRDADVLVDQNWYGPETATRYAGRLPAGCRQLLGPRYALLQPAYAEVRRSRPAVTHPPRRVIVSYGGADVTGETSRALEALCDQEFADVDVDVVIGSPNGVTDALKAQVAARRRTQLHVALPTVAHLLGTADLALGASGTATWERICLGVPAIVTTTRRSQSGVTAALARAGLTTWAGVGADLGVADHRKLLHEAMRRRPPVPPPLVDGQGAERVAEAIAPTADPRLEVLPATQLDMPSHLGDDPAGGARSRHMLLGPVVWDEEATAFAEDLEDPDVVRGVVRLDDLIIGRLRARREAENVRVTATLDDAVADRGWERHVRRRVVSAHWTVRSQGLVLMPGLGHPATDEAWDGDGRSGAVIDVVVPLSAPGV